ncbi:hypothetical protein [Salinicola sp. DM10]|uniref:hypothetical protein n=1 Tax=Salinicola sp. DM10 TaxID=2815721 RepID=UPI001A90900F|nr:hypothetical protein [Salinicola sp. DM10]MCE3025734.1 hypothetical protein [Salinicola sp. DM10]
MSLPHRVQEQADAAARHFQQLGNSEAADDQANVAPPASEHSQETDDGQHSQDDTPPTDQRQAEHQPQADSEQGAAYWRHRFNVSEGRLRTATDENRTLKETLRQRDERIAQMEQSGGHANGNLTAGEVTKLDQLKEEYGSDLVDALNSLIEHKLPKASPSDERVEKIEQRLQQEDQARNDDLEAQFWERLSQRVPRLSEINKDPGFLQWLGDVDRFSGVMRQQLLTDAQQQLDADRVADIFDAYSSGTQSSTHSDGASSGKREIPEDQVQPRQTRSTQTPAAEKVWTREEISQFYRDRQQGRYSKEEGERVEADIFAAQQQGRVH